MTIALIAHSQQDSAAAIGVCAVMPEARAVLWSDVSPTNREPLILLWSKAAAAEDLGERFAALALGRLAPVALCRLDETALAVDLAALNIECFDGALSGRAFNRAAHAALVEARRHGPVRRKALDAQRDDHAFAAGLARGFTSSVAVLGLGGVVAVGAADKVGAALAGEVHNPLAMFSTSSASAATYEEYGDHHIVERSGELLTDAEMRRAIAELQADAAADRGEIDARLAHAQTEIIEQSAATQGAVQALQSMSAHREALSPIRARPIIATPIAPATHTALADAPQDLKGEAKTAAVGEADKAAG